MTALFFDKIMEELRERSREIADEVGKRLNDICDQAHNDNPAGCLSHATEAIKALQELQMIAVRADAARVSEQEAG